jgi:hypothetical protein
VSNYHPLYIRARGLRALPSGGRVGALLRSVEGTNHSCPIITRHIYGPARVPRVAGGSYCVVVDEDESNGVPIITRCILVHHASNYHPSSPGLKP